MYCLLVYDIPDDRIRNRIADICLDYGLERIQYSAFFGELNRNRQEEMMQKCRRKLGDKPGVVQLFPVCERDLRLKKEVRTEGYGWL
jgi:CRISPR-associated protein Cas2